MKSLLENLRVELDNAIADRKELRADIRVVPHRRGEDDEWIYKAHITDVGTDFIQVKDRRITRTAILEVDVF